jgi:hypothetical protein
MDMGTEWSDRVLGDLADNVKRVIACYRDALHVYSRKAVPYWAGIKMKMDTAWSDRVLGDLADNVERAIACYRDALYVYTREALPYDWQASK